MTEVELFNVALAEVGAYRIDVETAVAFTAITAASPPVVTSTAHGYLTGELVMLRKAPTMTQVNGRIFRVTKLSANTYSLDEEDGTGYTAEATGGSSYRLSGGDEVEAIFRVWRSVRAEVLEEHSWNEATRYTRLARLNSTKTITGITKANPAVVTSAAHGYVDGNLVLVAGVLGMVEVNDRYFTVGGAATNTYQLAGEDSTGYTTYTSGGTSRKALTPLRPDFGYDCRYTLPTDCVRVLTLAEQDREDAQWEVVGGEVLTDEGPTVPIRYTFLLRDPALFGSKLFTAFAARLAHELAPKLTDSASREERAEKRWESQLERAKRTDGQEQGPTAIVDSTWIRERY